MEYLFNQALDSKKFGKMDSDSNGLVTKEEALPAVTQFLADMDMGVAEGLTHREKWDAEKNEGMFFQNCLQTKVIRALIVDKLNAGIAYFHCACDSDKNGMVTWEEVQSEHCIEAQDFSTGKHHFTREKFDTADANKDGALDKDEAKKVLVYVYNNGFD